jgi:hypothetical protein
MMRLVIGTAAFLATTGTAMAGIIGPVPGPEVGVGIASMTVLGVTVAWLRKRNAR